MPEKVRDILVDYQTEEEKKRDAISNAKLVIQGLVAAILVIALALHLAAVGLLAQFGHSSTYGT